MLSGQKNPVYDLHIIFGAKNFFFLLLKCFSFDEVMGATLMVRGGT